MWMKAYHGSKKKCWPSRKCASLTNHKSVKGFSPFHSFALQMCSLIRNLVFLKMSAKSSGSWSNCPSCLGSSKWPRSVLSSSDNKRWKSYLNVKGRHLILCFSFLWWFMRGKENADPEFIATASASKTYKWCSLCHKNPNPLQTFLW